MRDGLWLRLAPSSSQSPAPNKQQLKGKLKLTSITMHFTLAELQLLLGLATDQLFQREFIYARLPGCRPNVAELSAGKDLVRRMRLAAGMRDPAMAASSRVLPSGR